MSAHEIPVGKHLVALEPKVRQKVEEIMAGRGQRGPRVQVSEEARQRCIYMSDSMYEQLREEAHRRRISISEIIRESLTMRPRLIPRTPVGP